MIPLFQERRQKLTQFKALRPRPKTSTASAPEGLYTRCPDCKQDYLSDQVAANYFVCPGCGYHMRLTAHGRLRLVADKGSIRELNAGLYTTENLDFPGYSEKLTALEASTGLKEAVITGVCTIEGHSTVIAVMDSRFMMGSMGSVVGEKVSRAIEYATRRRLPIIIFTASGGARMQEGIVSLMQMAKTGNALARHHQAGLLYISCLTHPTTGGVTASFASLGDIILAEPAPLSVCRTARNRADNPPDPARGVPAFGVPARARLYRQDCRAARDARHPRQAAALHSPSARKGFAYFASG